MCCTKSSTATKSRSATVACPTLQKNTTSPGLKTCHYRAPADRPMVGKVNIMMPAQTYVGPTGAPSKTRFANHKSSFDNPNKRHSTDSSRQVKNLRSHENFLNKPVITTLSHAQVICAFGEIFSHL